MLSDYKCVILRLYGLQVNTLHKQVWADVAWCSGSVCAYSPTDSAGQGSTLCIFKIIFLRIYWLCWINRQNTAHRVDRGTHPVLESGKLVLQKEEKMGAKLLMWQSQDTVNYNSSGWWLSQNRSTSDCGNFGTWTSSEFYHSVTNPMKLSQVKVMGVFYELSNNQCHETFFALFFPRNYL